MSLNPCSSFSFSLLSGSVCQGTLPNEGKDSMQPVIQEIFRTLDVEGAKPAPLSSSFRPAVCLAEILKLPQSELEPLKAVFREWNFYPHLSLSHLFGFYFHQAYKEMTFPLDFSRKQQIKTDAWQGISSVILYMHKNISQRREFAEKIITNFTNLLPELPSSIEQKKLAELEKREREEVSLPHTYINREGNSLMLSLKLKSPSQVRREELQRKKKEELEEIGKKNREAIGNIVENIRKKIKECNDVVGLFLKIIYSDSCEILVDSDLLSCVDISGYIQSGKTENKIRNIEKFAEYISDLFVGASLLSGVTVSTEHLDTIHSILDTVKGSVSKKDITKLRQYFMDMCLQNRSLNEKAALDLDREGAGNLTYETYTGPAKLAAERVKLRTEEKDERASKVPLKSLLTATCIARRYEDSLKFQLFEMVEKEILVSVENYNPFCVQMKDLLRRLKEEPLKTEVGSEIFSKPLPQNFERFFCEVMEPLESVCYNFFNGDEYKSSREKIGLLEKDYYILTTWMEIFTGLHQESREAADAIAKIYSEIPEKIKGYIKSFRESLDFKETNDDFIENIEDYILEKSVFVMKALFIMHEIESIVKGTVYVNSDYPEEIEGPLNAIFASLKDLYAPLPIVPEAPFLTLSAKVKPTLVVTVEKVAEEQAVSFKGKSGKKTKKQELWVPTEKSSSEMSRHELESSHPFSTDLPRSTRKLLTFLEKLGFRLSRVKGDHAILKLKGKRGQVVIPVARDEQSLGTLKSIGRQAEEALRGKPAAAD